jgi:hypothetical protein
VQSYKKANERIEKKKEAPTTNEKETPTRKTGTGTKGSKQGTSRRFNRVKNRESTQI